MLSNTKPDHSQQPKKDSTFGFVFQRQTRPLIEKINSEILRDSIARLGPHSIITSTAFSQTHE